MIDSNDNNRIDPSEPWANSTQPPTPEQEALRAQVEETIEAQRKLEEEPGDITAKRAAQLEKLRMLGQDVLDAIYDERAFNNDPRFKAIFEIVDGPTEPTKEQALFVVGKLSEMGPEVRTEYLTKAFSLPMKRIRAINKYVEYRDMLEDFS